MGRTGGKNVARGVVAANEGFVKDLNTPDFVTVPSQQGQVSYLFANDNPDVTHDVANVFLPVSGDIANETVEITMFYDEQKNPILMHFPVFENGVQKFVDTFAYTEGHPSKINIPLSISPAVKNAIHIHNHPNAGGISLSDVNVARAFNLRGVEARLNPKRFKDHVDDLLNHNTDLRYMLKELKSELSQHKPSLEILNQMERFMSNHVNSDYSGSVMVAQIRKNGTKWPPIKQKKIDDLQVAAFYIRGRLYEETGLTRDATQFLTSHAFMQSAAETNGFSYGIYQS